MCVLAESLVLLSAWQKWSIYAPAVLDKLVSIFLAPSEEDKKQQGGVAATLVQHAEMSSRAPDAKPAAASATHTGSVVPSASAPATQQTVQDAKRLENVESEKNAAAMVEEDIDGMPMEGVDLDKLVAAQAKVHF